MRRSMFRLFLLGFAVGCFYINGTVAHAENLPSSAAVETARPSTPPPPTPYGFQQMVFDLKYVVKRPFNLDKQDGLSIGGLSRWQGRYLHTGRTSVIASWIIKVRV